MGNNLDIKKLFGSNVRKYRLQKKLSQEQLAELAELHRTYISAVECGKRSIALDNIQKIAQALEIEIYKLFLPEEN
ncbi:helix-turn-helix domain-containing protein [Carboxydothermus islandicus]|uniref:helix-turn-helix domain-containing protein n=1 Tax=Carboxydothermus islandicus TaxID=661089 RepID=UPI00096AAC90|nr:helix-turn-helix transcriptional regulator [Carboxydothermus islandicus]